MGMLFSVVMVPLLVCSIMLPLQKQEGSEPKRGMRIFRRKGSLDRHADFSLVFREMGGVT